MNIYNIKSMNGINIDDLSTNVINNTTSITTLEGIVNNNTTKIGTLENTVSQIPEFEIINDLSNVSTTKLLQSEALKQLLKLIVKSISSGIVDKTLQELFYMKWVKILEDNGIFTIQIDDEQPETTTELDAINYINNNLCLTKNLVVSKSIATDLTFNLNSNQNLIVIAEEPTLIGLNNALTGINATGGKIWAGIEKTTATTTIDLSSNLTCENVYSNDRWCKFSENTSLKNVKIGKDVDIIENSCFRNCKNLTTINIPNNVISIGYDSFYSCSNLTSIDIPNSVSYIGNECFYSCSNLQTINLPSSIDRIYDSCFQYCTNLSSIIIPNNVSVINNQAFYKCYNLSSIDISNSVISIGNYCFHTCSNLTIINAPNVYYIGNYCFNKCSSLSELHVGVLTTCGSLVFDGINSGTINIYIHTDNLTNATNTATTLNTNKGGTVSLLFYYNPNEWTQITL